MIVHLKVHDVFGTKQLEAIIHHGDGGNNGRQTQIVIRITDNQSHATTDIQQHSETDIRGRHLFCSISACTEYVSAKSSVQHKPCIQRAWAQAHGHSTCSLLTMTFIFTTFLFVPIALLYFSANTFNKLLLILFSLGICYSEPFLQCFQLELWF